MPIAIIGDFDPSFPPHQATNTAFNSPIWLPTKSLADVSNANSILNKFSGLLIAPGSPYQSMDGALSAIRFARENRLPLLATCGGFQHVVIEYARNVLGFQDAAHEEYEAGQPAASATDPYASPLFVSRLSCSLVGKKMEVRFTPGSRARQIYGQDSATEHYYCNFGLNPQYQQFLDAGGLRISGVDQDGEARILEIPGHPFFLAALFLPQMNTSPERPHPLLAAFQRALG